MKLSALLESTKKVISSQSSPLSSVPPLPSSLSLSPLLDSIHPSQHQYHDIANFYQDGSVSTTDTIHPTVRASTEINENNQHIFFDENNGDLNSRLGS